MLISCARMYRWIALGWLLAVGSLIANAGCSAQASTRCESVCKRAEECAETMEDPNFKFDKGECTAACSFLEKDDKGNQLVARYAECLKDATNCTAVIECE